MENQQPKGAMKHSYFVKSIVCLFVLCGALLGLGANTELVDPNAASFIGLDYSYSKREGFYDFKELRRSQSVPRNSLSMLGGIAGKRWKINSVVRFQAGLGFEVGSVMDDTLFLETPVINKYSFYHMSLDPVLQLSLGATGRTRPFLLLGGGINFVRVSKRTFTLDKSLEIIYSNLPWIYIRSDRFSISATGGFGMDCALSRSATMSFWYALRYWQPVRYGIEDGFLYSAQPYHETFFSNHFNLVLLFDFR
jgi:hypothetical protein